MITDSEGNLAWAIPDARYSVQVESRDMFTGINLPTTTGGPAIYPSSDAHSSTTCDIIVRPWRARKLPSGDSSISPGTTRVKLDALTLDEVGLRWTDTQDCFLQYHGHDIGYSLTALANIGTATTRSCDPDVPDLTEFNIIAKIQTGCTSGSAALQGPLIDATQDSQQWCYCSAVQNAAATSMTAQGPDTSGSGVPATGYHFVHWQPPPA